MNNKPLSPFEKCFGESFSGVRVMFSDKVKEGTFIRTGKFEAVLNAKDYLRLNAADEKDIGFILESLKQSFEAVTSIGIRND